MKFRGIISFLLGCLLILTPITSVNAVDGEDSSGIFFSRREPCVSNSYKPPIDFEYETENEKYLNSSPQFKPKFEPRFTPGSPQNVRITSNDTTSVCLVWEPPYIQFERLTYLVFQDNLPEGGEKLITETTSPSLELGGLTGGKTYTFSVLAQNSSGQQSKRVHTSITLPADTTPPTAPARLTVVSQDASSITLSWIASTDDWDTPYYHIYNGTNYIGWTRSTTYKINTIAQQNYSFLVKAYDLSGNESEPSNIVNVNVLPSIVYYYDVNGRVDFILINNQKVKYYYDENNNLIKREVIP